MIDQVADKNWLLRLSVAILIDARSQSVYGSLSQFFSRVFFKCTDHTVTTYSITGVISLAPEKFPNGWTSLPFYRPQMAMLMSYVHCDLLLILFVGAFWGSSVNRLEITPALDSEKSRLVNCQLLGRSYRADRSKRLNKTPHQHQ
jgi:hypothetical protein